MTDFSWSFVRGDSTQQPGTRPPVPKTEPVVSILRLKFGRVEKQQEFLPAEDHGEEAVDGIDVIVQSLIRLIESEPGFDYCLRACEEKDMKSNTVFLFVGWQRHPSAAFSSVESFVSLTKSSAKTASMTMLAPQTSLWNVPFTTSLRKEALSRRKAPVELVAWDIPAHLDPTFHQACAKEFAGLNYPFGLIREWIGCDGPGDLMWCLRGWATQNENVEPSDRSHVFLLFWRSTETQARYKDPNQPTFLHGRGGSRTGEVGDDFWERTFVALQERWQAKGMTVTNTNLMF